MFAIQDFLATSVTAYICKHLFEFGKYVKG